MSGLCLSNAAGASIVGFLLVLVAPGIRSSGALASPARSVDALVQEHAYRSLDRPITGKIYDVGSPADMSGVEVSVARFRWQSFRARGIGRFKEFNVPAGPWEGPFALRIAFVYRSLGNWSSVYYPLPGYTCLTPVVGLLAYDGTNLSATNPPELDLIAPETAPITIDFSGTTGPPPSGARAFCVHFRLNGSHGIGDPTKPGNLCTAYSLGHFAAVADSSSAVLPAPAPSPAPGAGGKRGFPAWKAVASVAGGSLASVAVLTFVVRLRNHNREEKMARRAEDGEVLGSRKVGDARLPAASMVRTRPTLEKDDTP